MKKYLFLVISIVLWAMVPQRALTAPVLTQISSSSDLAMGDVIALKAVSGATYFNGMSDRTSAYTEESFFVMVDAGNSRFYLATKASVMAGAPKYLPIATSGNAEPGQSFSSLAYTTDASQAATFDLGNSDNNKIRFRTYINGNGAAVYINNYYDAARYFSGTGDFSKYYVYKVTEGFSAVNSTGITEGWYQLKWNNIGSDGSSTDYTDATVSGQYVTNYDRDVTVSSNPYALYLDAAPDVSDLDEYARTFVYVENVTAAMNGQTQTGVNINLRSANGHYITRTGASAVSAPSDKNVVIYVNSGNLSVVTITSATSGTGRTSLLPKGKDATPYVGVSSADKLPGLQFSPVPYLSLLGLQPWTVEINGLSETVSANNAQVTYSGSDSYGLTSVYNGGTFFLSSGVVPDASEFSGTENSGATPIFRIDAAQHKIIAQYPVAPVNVNTGWYMVKWVETNGDTNTDYSDAEVAGKYVRNYAQDVTVNSTPYPLYLANAPATISEQAASLVHFTKIGNGTSAGNHGNLRSANGHYITQSGAASIDAPSAYNYIIYRSSGTYPYSSVISSGETSGDNTRKSLIPCGQAATPYIGQTVAGKFPMVQFYSVDPSDLGLQPWTVVVDGFYNVVASTNPQVSYTGSGAYGLTSVYEGGTFFLESSVTPTASDFSAPTLNGFTPTVTVDAENHTVTVAYVPVDGQTYLIKTAYPYNSSQRYLYNNNGTMANTATAGTTIDYIWRANRVGSGKYTFYNLGAAQYMGAKVFSSSAYTYSVGYSMVNHKSATINVQNEGNLLLWMDGLSRFLTNDASDGDFDQADNVYASGNRYCVEYVFTPISIKTLTITTTPNVEVSYTWNGQTKKGTTVTFSCIGGETVSDDVITASYNGLVYTSPTLSTAAWDGTNNLEVSCTLTPNMFSENYGDKWVRWRSAKNTDLVASIASVAADANVTMKSLDYFDESQLWCFVGDASSFTIYNKAAGSTYVLTSGVAVPVQNSTISLQPVASASNSTWTLGSAQLTSSDAPGFVLYATGGDGSYGCHGWTSDAVMKYWGSASGGSHFLFDDANGLVELIMDGLDTSVMTDYTHNVGVPTITIGNSSSTSGLLSKENTSITAYVPLNEEVTFGTPNVFQNYSFIGYNGTESTVTLTATTSSSVTATFGYNREDARYLWEPLRINGAEPDYYRIPAIVTAHNGDILAINDRRYNNDKDLGNNNGTSGVTSDHHIDIIGLASSDNGATWSDEFMVMDGTGTGSTAGYGDAAVVADSESDKVLVMACGGNIFYSASTSSIHQTVDRVVLTHNGTTWVAGAIEDKTSYFYTGELASSAGLFIGSGSLTQSTKIKKGAYYRVYCAILAKSSQNYVLYSDDFGATWTYMGSVAANGDEPKVAELPDGSVLLSSRKSSGRYFNIWTWDDDTYTTGSWGTAVATNNQTGGMSFGSNSTNGDIRMIPAKRISDGASVILAMQSVPTASGRAEVSLYYKELDPAGTFTDPATVASNWSSRFLITPYSSAYSAFNLQNDGRIGFFMEENPMDVSGIGFYLCYVPLTISEITDGLYTYSTDDRYGIFTISNSTGTFTSGNSGNTWFNTWTSTQTTPTVTLKASGGENNMQWSGTNFKLYGDGGKTYTITLPENYCIDAVSATFNNIASREGTLNIGGHSYSFGSASPQAVNLTDLNSGNTLTFTLTSHSAAVSANRFFTTSGITIVYHEVPMVNFKNTSSNQIVASSPVPVGTSSVGCVAATVQGDLSPLVSYGTPTYDYATNSYTVPYTVQSPTYSGATWYYVRINPTDSVFISYDPMAEILDGYGHPISRMTTFGREYLWAFIGDPYVGIQVYNDFAGGDKKLAVRTGTDRERLHFTEDGTTFIVGRNANGFTLHAGTNTYLNNRNACLSVWKSDGGANDNGSTLILLPLSDEESLHDYLYWPLHNYIPDFLGDGVTHHFGALGDFANETDLATRNLQYNNLLNNYNTLTVNDYKLFLTGLRPHPTTGNYRLLNVSTGKYLGHNVSFGLRGYSEGDNSGANGITDGTYSNGQYLSTIWQINVVDASAPVISGSGKYVGASTVLQNTNSASLVMCNYPLTYAIGVNGFGALTSSDDNVGASATSSENSYDNIFAYKAAASQWRLIPAEQTTFTLTANVLGDWSFATFYAPFDARIETEDTYAYWLLDSNVDRDENSASMTVLAEKDGVIPAGTPVVLINKSATTSLEFTPMNSNTATFDGDNIIRGTYERILFDDSNRDSYLIFGKSNGNAGFFKPKNGAKLLANRCYLDNSTSSYAMGFKLFFLDPDDGAVTALPVSSLMMEDGMPVYDLQGRRVEGTPRGGVYIIGGKKVYVK